MTWEFLDEPTARFGLPFLAEHDVWFGRRILGLARPEPAQLQRRLDARPDDVEAMTVLAGLDLRRPEALRGLDRALSISPAHEPALLYRGAARRLQGDKRWREDLEKLPGSPLAALLLGQWERAARLEPTCAAAFLGWARSTRRWELAEGALDADPTYALITLSWHKPGGRRSWTGHLKRLVEFAFREPQRAGWYYRQQDIHYSPYQLEEYADSRRLLDALPERSWAEALVARGALRCPPSAARQGEGLRLARRAAERRPSFGWFRAWVGLALIKEGRGAEALPWFDECVRLQPFYHRGYAWRGALRRKLGDAPGALADLNRALSVDEQYAFAWHERSLARRAARDWAGAALDLDRAFLLDHRYRWVFTVGREPSAAEVSAALDELRGQTLPSLLSWKGELLAERGRRSEAVRELQRAVQADPHHAFAWAQLGRLRGDLDALRKAVKLEPACAQYEAWLAELEFRKGLGLRRLDALIKRTLMPHWLLHLRGELRLEQGRPREALADARRAARLEGRHADGYYLEARALLALGRKVEARAAVEKALLISPNLGRAYVLRAALGSAQEAVRDYRTVLERFPYLFNEEERGRVAALLAA